MFVINARCHNDSSNSDVEIGVSNTKRVNAADIPNDKHLDRYNHWPILMKLKNAHKCKLGVKG